MKSIKEKRVNWNILSDTFELVLPLDRSVYPIWIQIFDGANQIVYEAEFKQTPILLKDLFQKGNYQYKVWKDNQCILYHTIHF